MAFLSERGEEIAVAVGLRLFASAPPAYDKKSYLKTADLTGFRFGWGQAARPGGSGDGQRAGGTRRDVNDFAVGSQSRQPHPYPGQMAGVGDDDQRPVAGGEPIQGTLQGCEGVDRDFAVAVHSMNRRASRSPRINAEEGECAYKCQKYGKTARLQAWVPIDYGFAHKSSSGDLLSALRSLCQLSPVAPMPVIESSRIEVSAVRPDEGMDFRVQTHLLEQRRVAQGTKIVT